jgi:hypothetical protein
MFAIVLLAIVNATAQTPPPPLYVTTGIFIASIEEGARIFTPTRLLPFGHPEALTHEFPTVQQFHGGEDQVLLIIGQAAGLGLAGCFDAMVLIAGDHLQMGRSGYDRKTRRNLSRHCGTRLC